MVSVPASSCQFFLSFNAAWTIFTDDHGKSVFIEAEFEQTYRALRLVLRVSGQRFIFLHFRRTGHYIITSYVTDTPAVY